MGGDRRCSVDHPAAAPTELTFTPHRVRNPAGWGGVYLPNRALRVRIFRGSVYG